MGRGLGTLLVLCAGALLGLVAGWWLFDRGPGASAPVSLTAEAAVLSTAEALAVEHAPDVRSVAEAGSPLQPSRLVEPRRTELETRPGPTGGDGRLRGKVTTADNRPLPGVRIEISQREYRPVLFDPARRGLSLHNDIHTARLVRTTDEQGGFEFADLVDALWDLRASAEGWTIEPLRFGWGPVGSNANVALVATPLLRLPISVLQADGTSADRAMIELRPLGGATTTYQHWVWTRAEPNLELPDKPFELRALAEEQVWLGPGHPMPSAWASPLASVTGSSGALVLTLAPRACVVGAVNDAQGDRAVPPRTSALCFPLDGRELPLSDNWPAQAHSTGLSNGPRFQFLDLQPGRHGLGLRVGSLKHVTGAVEVDVPNGVVRKDLTVSTAELPAIRLSLYAHDGAPYAGDLMVALTVMQGEGMSQSHVNVLRLPDGTFEIPPGHRATEFLLGTDAAHAAALELTTKTYGYTDVKLLAGTYAYEVRFAEPSSLVLHVTGARPSSAAAWLSVKLSREEEGAKDGRGRASAGSISVDGSVGQPIEVGPVEPGSYRVDLEWCRGARNEHWDSRSLARRTIRLAPGPNSLHIELPPLHELLVVGGTDLVGHTVVALGFGLAPQVVGSGRQDFDEHGEARIADLPAGRYLLTCNGRVTWAEVPGPAVSAPFAAAGSILVRVHNPTGAFAAAGFEDGDRILKVQGKAFGEGPSVEDTLRALGFGSDQRARFDIERNGIAFTIELPLASVASAHSLGASFHFAP